MSRLTTASSLFYLQPTHEVKTRGSIMTDITFRNKCLVIRPCTTYQSHVAKSAGLRSIFMINELMKGLHLGMNNHVTPL